MTGWDTKTVGRSDVPEGYDRGNAGRDCEVVKKTGGVCAPAPGKLRGKSIGEKIPLTNGSFEYILIQEFDAAEGRRRDNAMMRPVDCGNWTERRGLVEALCRERRSKTGSERL